VVGRGQAGLAAGYYLARTRIPFLILDAETRVGESWLESWRRRWDFLELFTPARYSAIPELAFPGDPECYPGKTRWPTTSSTTPTPANYPSDTTAGWSPSSAARVATGSPPSRANTTPLR
jgi:putative flavoprotein involved in K+ transport